MGIITADVGTRGALDTRSDPEGDCTEDGDGGVMIAARGVTGNYLIHGADQQNFSGTLADAFAASMADAITTNGCSFSRPFEALRRALVSPFNPQFLRPDARLSIVIITPRDDCSFAHASFTVDGNCNTDPLVDIGEYQTFLHDVKTDPFDVLVSAACGPASPPSCTIGMRSAEPGVRIHALLDRFPERSTSATLCQDDLTGAIQQPGDLGQPVANPCLELEPADLDPIAPGLQPDCTAWLEDRGSGAFTQTLLTRCTETPDVACWDLVTDASACPMAPGLVVVVRGVVSTRSHPINVVLECLVE
jgi:hypothetical protein